MHTDCTTTELGGNAYYRVTCSVLENKDAGKWFAKVRVTRVDTDELIKAGFTVAEDTKETAVENALRRVSESLLPELNRAGEPRDWNSATRSILARCKRLRYTIVQFGSYSVDGLRSGVDEDKYLDGYSEFWNMLIKESVGLSGSIEKLSYDERNNILILPDDVLLDPSDAWSLDELDARIMVFNFFMHPTSQERHIHELQRKRLADRFEELGWATQ